MTHKSLIKLSQHSKHFRAILYHDTEKSGCIKTCRRILKYILRWRKSFFFFVEENDEVRLELMHRSTSTTTMESPFGTKMENKQQQNAPAASSGLECPQPR